MWLGRKGLHGIHVRRKKEKRLRQCCFSLHGGVSSQDDSPIKNKAGSTYVIQVTERIEENVSQMKWKTIIEVARILPTDGTVIQAELHLRPWRLQDPFFAWLKQETFALILMGNWSKTTKNKTRKKGRNGKMFEDRSEWREMELEIYGTLIGRKVLKTDGNGGERTGESTTHHWKKVLEKNGTRGISIRDLPFSHRHSLLQTHFRALVKSLRLDKKWSWATPNWAQHLDGRPMQVGQIIVVKTLLSRQSYRHGRDRAFLRITTTKTVEELADQLKYGDKHN